MTSPRSASYQSKQTCSVEARVKGEAHTVGQQCKYWLYKQRQGLFVCVNELNQDKVVLIIVVNH